MHLQRCTRPDISNAVRDLARYQHCYTSVHFNALNRVLRYLKGTSDYGLLFDGSNPTDQVVKVYSDASFGDKELSRKSVTGYAVKLAGVPVCYCSVAQKSVSISTMEAELIACSEACRESEWLRMLLGDMGFEYEAPVQVFCDNQATVALIKNPINHSGSKHIEIRHLFARELQELNKIDIQHIGAEEMISDIFTKPLPEKQFVYLREKLGVKPCPKDMCSPE